MKPSTQTGPGVNPASCPQRSHSLAAPLPAICTGPALQTRPVLNVAPHRLDAVDLCVPQAQQAPVRLQRAPTLQRVQIPYFVKVALMRTAKRGQTDVASFLINNLIPRYSSSQGGPVRGKLARDGHLGLVRLFFESGANINSHASSCAYSTLLMWAGETGRLDVVEYLLSRGATPAPDNSSGFTRLKFVAGKKHFDVLTRLTGVNNVPALDYRGKSALMFAIQGGGDIKVIEFLCGLHANVNHADSTGKSVLMYAALAKSPQAKEIIDILLDAGAQINQRDHAGNTALMHACDAGNAKAVHTLLDAGAEIEAQNNRGRSVLWFAVNHAIRNNVKTAASIIEALVMHGADRSKIILDGQVTDFLRDRMADVSIDSSHGVAEEAGETSLRVMVAGRPCSAAAFFSTLLAQKHVPYFVLPAWFTGQGWSSPVVSLTEAAFKGMKTLRATLYAIATPGMVIQQAQKLALYAAVFANLRFQQSPYADSGFSDAAVSRMRQRAEAELATLVEIANHADAGLRACLGNLFADCLTACPEHNSLKAALLSVLLQTQAGLIAPLAELVVSSWLAALEQTGSVADMEGNADGAGGPDRLQALKTAFIVSFRKLLDSQAVFENMRGNIANARTHMPRPLRTVEINHVAYEDLMVRQIQYLKDYFEALAAAPLAHVLPDGQ